MFCQITFQNIFLLAARKNRPPRAEVFPKDQTITLPTNTIILDASSKLNIITLRLIIFISLSQLKHNAMSKLKHNALTRLKNCLHYD